VDWDAKNSNFSEHVEQRVENLLSDFRMFLAPLDIRERTSPGKPMPMKTMEA
jgi:hypothetical protein